MRLSSFVFLAVLCLQIVSAGEVNSTWNNLQSKRATLTIFHQEFEISQSSTVGENVLASKSSITLDSAAGRWRQASISGAGNHVEMFDGQELYEFEDGGSEYVRVKRSSTEAPPPPVYATTDLDLLKIVERGRQPCGLSNVDHQCVTLEVPVKPQLRKGSASVSKVLGGSKILIFDTVTGLLISSRTIENIQTQRGGHQLDVTCMLKRMGYNGTVANNLFTLPPTATKEVKELPRWDAGRIRKQLAGKAAPDFTLTDFQGHSIRLSDLKGKTVLLDFWTTWCGPCRADGPSLDKLYAKYGGKNLAMIGVSVNEERSVVEKFLLKYPHQYPIVLTTENEMPRAYQIRVLPTYVIVDPEGNVASAAEGDKGFSELRKLLRKAGLQTE